MTPVLITVLALIFFLSCTGTWELRKIAFRHHLLDIPNRRSSHHTPVPRTGGLAILLSFYLGGVFLALTGRLEIPHLLELGVCGLGIAIVGFLDDLFHLSALLRLIVHFLCVFAAVYFFIPVEKLFSVWGAVLPFVPVKFLLVVGVVWLLNLYNFMDGIDGLAGAEAISAALGAGIILSFNGEVENYLPILLVLVAATLGFLVWNWPPAKVFMGDAGSSFIGFCFGIFALLTASSTGLSLSTWGILLASFVVDSTVTLVVRIRRGKKFYRAHRSHAYQILARRAGSHLKVTLGYTAVNWLFLFPLACFSVYKPGYGPYMVIFSYSLLAILCIFIGSGRTND